MLNRLTVIYNYFSKRIDIPSHFKKEKIPYILMFLCFTFIVLFFMTGQASAEFKGENDWEGSERNLCYKLDNSINEKWKKWIEEAIKNWNDVSDKTGWSFEKCKNGEEVDIEFELSDDKDANGGAETNPWPQDPIKKINVHIDKNLSDETWPGGKKVDGWGKKGKNKLDPVLVLKHELTHVMRLDHSGGTDTGNLEDPIGPGNHDNPKNRTPSDDDINESKKAAQDREGWGKKKPLGPPGGNFSHMGMRLAIPEGALTENVSIEISPITRTHTPDPTKLDNQTASNTRGIVSGVVISTEKKGVELLKPVTISISYTEDDIGGGYILGMRHSKIFPAIDERSIQAYTYDRGNNIWSSISSKLDMENNTVSFQTNHFGIFGAGGEKSTSQKAKITEVSTTNGTRGGQSTISIKAQNTGGITVQDIHDDFTLASHQDGGGIFTVNDSDNDGHNESVGWAWPRVGTHSVSVTFNIDSNSQIGKRTFTIIAKDGTIDSRPVTVAVEESTIDIYDRDNNNRIDGGEVKSAITCFLFGKASCISNRRLTGIEIKRIIRVFLFR